MIGFDHFFPAFYSVFALLCHNIFVLFLKKSCTLMFYNIPYVSDDGLNLHQEKLYNAFKQKIVKKI